MRRGRAGALSTKSDVDDCICVSASPEHQVRVDALNQLDLLDVRDSHAAKHLWPTDGMAVKEDRDDRGIPR
jgi:hypothetical protein